MIKNLCLNTAGGVFGALLFVLIAFLIEQSGLLPPVNGEDNMNLRFIFFSLGYTFFIILGCTVTDNFKKIN